MRRLATIAALVGIFVAWATLLAVEAAGLLGPHHH